MNSKIVRRAALSGVLLLAIAGGTFRLGEIAGRREALRDTQGGTSHFPNSNEGAKQEAAAPCKTNLEPMISRANQLLRETVDPAARPNPQPSRAEARSH